MLDPWRGGSPTNPVPGQSDSVHIVNIWAAAHHLDLRAGNAQDPSYVTAARAVEKAAIRQWIVEYHESKMKQQRQL